ncbi:MAG: thioredoxin domain-containing protein [bacterium]
MKIIKENLFTIIIVLTVMAGAGLIIFSARSGEDWRIQYANNLGLNVDQFTKDITSATLKQKVDADIKEGNDRGVTGTPTIFVNQVSLPFSATIKDDLDKKITELLATNPDQILIEEFTDYQCPVCKEYHTNVAELVTKYQAEEKVVWVYKNYPIQNLHPFAYEAAIAVEAARNQSKFTEMAELLYGNQENFKGPKF